MKPRASMNAERLLHRIVSAFILILVWALPACAPGATPTIFRPPGGSRIPATPLYELSPVTTTPSIPPTDFPTLTPTPLPTSPACTDNLTFLFDLTFDDDTEVLPGQSIDKRWLVQNSGTCDWDVRYRLRNINGERLGAAEEIPLYPARAAAQVVLRIVFSAPSTPGAYLSEWQAVGPLGEFFGDPVYIQIIVAP